jgi:hypothetical protein
MTAVHIGQLAAAAALFVGGIALYRRNREADRGYGSQGAVLMWAAGAIFLILGLGLLEYRPSHSELEAFKARAQ